MYELQKICRIFVRSRSMHSVVSIPIRPLKKRTQSFPERSLTEVIMIFEEQINVQLKRLCLDIAKPKVEAVVFVILPGKYFLTLGPLWLAVFSVLEISRVNCFYIQSNSVV